MTLQFRDDDFAAKLTGCDNLTPRQKQAVDKLADQLVELDFVQNYHQSEHSRDIQDSAWGYALWQELLTRHRVEVQTLAEYGVKRVPRNAQHWREEPFDRDNPWTAPCEMLIVASDPSQIHPLSDTYIVVAAVPHRIDCCDIAITDKCSNRATDELFVKHGQMLGFWHACGYCLLWLTGMARVEREQPEPGDTAEQTAERKAKHYREVDYMYGTRTRDLTGFMRPDSLPGRRNLRAVEQL